VFLLEEPQEFREFWGGEAIDVDRRDLDVRDQRGGVAQEGEKVWAAGLGGGSMGVWGAGWVVKPSILVRDAAVGGGYGGAVNLVLRGRWVVVRWAWGRQWAIVPDEGGEARCVASAAESRRGRDVEAFL